MECNECKSKECVKAGTQMTKKFGRLQRYLCQKCGHVFLKPLDQKQG